MIISQCGFRQENFLCYRYQGSISQLIFRKLSYTNIHEEKNDSFLILLAQFYFSFYRSSSIFQLVIVQIFMKIFVESLTVFFNSRRKDLPKELFRFFLHFKNNFLFSK